MADSNSHQTFVDLLQDGLRGNETTYRDIVESKLVNDFFSEDSFAANTGASSETVRIASFDIGNYNANEVEWKTEDGSVCICGKKARSTTTGSTGSKFIRCVPIPDNINAKTVNVRFCVGGGLLVVEGMKQKTRPPLRRNTSKTAFFGDSHFSLSVDLGDGEPMNMDVRCGVEDRPKNESIKLF